MEQHMAEPASGTFSLFAIGKWLFAFAKTGFFGKIATMFAASAIGAAIIAAAHAETRKETWWRALGAGVGGVVVGGIVLRAAAHYVVWLQPPTGGGDALWDWIFTVVGPLLFTFGALFWGFVGALGKLQKMIADRGANVVGGKAGL